MFTCSICGQAGGSYVDTVDSLSGAPLTEYVHPTCKAKISTSNGVAEYTTLSTRPNHFRGTANIAIPHYQRIAMRTMRIPVGRMGQSTGIRMHQLQGQRAICAVQRKAKF